MDTKKDSEKNEYITRKDLEEQTQIILSALDERFGVVNKRFASLEKHVDEVRDDLRIDINNLQTLIDGYVKAQEDFKQEFEIMKKEMDILKKIVKEKLGMEVKLA